MYGDRMQKCNCSHERQIRMPLQLMKLKQLLIRIEGRGLKGNMLENFWTKKGS